jgi:DNA-binding NarL/FixJ family response regulator
MNVGGVFRRRSSVTLATQGLSYWSNNMPKPPETDETYQPESSTLDPFSKIKTPLHAPPRLRVALAGGKKLIRRAMEQLIESRGIVVAGTFENLDDLAEALQRQNFDVLLLMLAGMGPFESLHQIRQTLANATETVPLIILAGKLDRSQVYTALRIGAKSYLSEDADPDELVRAIRTVAAGSVYLSPQTADMLVSDISTAQQESPNKPRLPSIELSRRELEIVQLLCEGLSSKQIAGRLHISTKTVENHRYNIYRKWHIDSIAGLIRHAVMHGVVTLA